ncbi:hypothetical protein EON65_16335 [archaeon]|nr:MAG: hypothetical protein EON65_16335 [archaeon]
MEDGLVAVSFFLLSVWFWHHSIDKSMESSSAIVTRRPLSTSSSRAESMGSRGTCGNVDYLMNPDIYFENLMKLSKHAHKIQLKEEEEEAKLLQYLTLAERSNLNKEGKVLTRWQERQRDWDKVQTIINKQLSSKVNRPLMMATTDEYRGRMEEYDLIQAAIPLKERFAESAWEMSLRGGGPVRVPVGHIFSGLECMVDPNLSKPKIVRKPKSLQNTWKSGTFVPQSEAFQKRRKQLLKTITEMRPRDINVQDASTLVVKSTNLFKWASESSQTFLQALQEQRNALSQEASEETKSLVTDEEAMLFEKEQAKLPRIEFLSDREVLFETQTGRECRREVVFKNIGTATVYYRFERIPEGHEDNEKGKRSSHKKHEADILLPVNKLLDSKGDRDADLRNRVLNQRRDSFFCLKQSGELLPDELVSVPFVFRDCSGGGYYQNKWKLCLTPDSSKIFFSVQENGGNNSIAGSLSLTLIAHCMLPDENLGKRLASSAIVDNCVLSAYMTDIVSDCIKRVRQPVRRADYEKRQIALFQRKNNALIETLCYVNDMLPPPPLFFTISRVRHMESLKFEVKEFYHTLTSAYCNVLSEYNSWAAKSGVQAAAIEVPAMYGLLSEHYNEVKKTLFPEATIVSTAAKL